MDKLNKNILTEIITKVGSWPEIIRLQLVCKRFKSIIEEMHHYFTFQGVRQPNLIPTNVQIDKFLQNFLSGWKLRVLDLRNTNISVELLAEVLLAQPSLRKLDLTNTQLSVGQVWSCMQAKKPKDVYCLEELRITNNHTVYLGYEALVNVYPELLRLYIGNTLTMLEHLRLLLSKLNRLQILDCSLCNIDYYDQAYIGFRELLQASDLQRFFISEINEVVVDTFLSFNVEIVENTIGDILKQLQTEDNLLELEDWLRLGGDVNLQCSPSHNLWHTLGSHPQIEFIKKCESETVLRDAFKLMIHYDLDLSHHFYDQGEGVSLLNATILKGQTGLAHLLISQGCDISPSAVLNEQPAMTLAATQGDMSIIQLFLDFDLYRRDNYSPRFCNPICAAAALGNTELFMFLIEQGVPLFHCAIHPNILIASKEILEMALSPEHKDSFVFPTPMLYEAAQYHASHHNIDQALLIINNMESTVKDEEAAVLEENRQKPKRISSDMHKPLLVIATEKKLMSVVKALVEKGYDINGEDMHGWTPFISAASFGHLEIIPYLCENGALVNKRDKWWRTALHQAAQNGHTEVVRELIRYGAALSPECDRGLTPLNYAILNHRVDAERILREHGARCARDRKIRCSVF